MSDNKLYKRTKTMMSTLVSISIEHSNKRDAHEIIRCAFAEMDRLVNLMNYFDENSEIGRLNKHGFLDNVSPETIEVLKIALQFSDISQGAFDISILPLLTLQTKYVANGGRPSEMEVAQALKLVNYRDIVLEENKVKFCKAGMSVTLAGVAKGYIVDKAIELLNDAGIKRAIVNAGGDIRMITGIEDSPWKIGVKDPLNKTNVLTIINMFNGAVATSGTYQREFHDIIEPKTGALARDVLSATVIADKAVKADILATCIYILGADKGISLINSTHDADALVITQSKKIFKSDWNSDFNYAKVI